MAERDVPTGAIGATTRPARHTGWPFRLLALGVVAFVALIGVRAFGEITPGGTSGGGGAAGAGASNAPPVAPTSPGASIAVSSYLDPFPRPAPPLTLTGAGGAPVAIEDFRGDPVLVFFGYTHCPDVCPVTIGAVGEAIAAVGGDAAAIFVSVDPERDTVPWLAEFVQYMPTGFTAVTGTPAEVRATADAWGVRYARVETDDPEAYSMSHTADVFVVDGAGQFRARLPFGTDVPTMTAVIRAVAETTSPPSPAATTAPPSSTPSPAAIEDLVPQVVSSSVWARGASPVILTSSDASGPLDDPSLTVTVTVVDAAGNVVGVPVPAVTVQPEGIETVSFVATVDLPSPGTWRLRVDATDATGATHRGTTRVEARDPGGTAILGAPAPSIRTPTAADFGGDLTWVTTDPDPDPRLSGTSTADALAAGRPFVLVVDSYSFKVTPACGKAVVMAKQLIYRWTDVPFIHHEPYRYTVITTEPVIEGSLADPVLTEPAAAWGVGSDPWGVGSMPWLFVVDGDGIVRAKYQGVMGSADVDVMLTLLASEAEGVPAG